jgi:hypothetical protein
MRVYDIEQTALMAQRKLDKFVKAAGASNSANSFEYLILGQ